MLWLVSSSVCNAAAGHHGELAAGCRAADSSKAVPRAAAAPYGASQLRAVPGVGARAVAEKTRACSRTCGDDLALEDAPQEVARRRVHACRHEQWESISVLDAAIVLDEAGMEAAFRCSRPRIARHSRSGR